MYNWSISVSFFINSYHFLLPVCSMYILLYLGTENRKHVIWKWTSARRTLKHLFGNKKNFSFTAISVYKTRILLFALIKIRLNGKEWKRFPILNPIWYLFKVQYILCWLKVFFRKRFYICHHHQMNQPHLILLLLNRIQNLYLSTEQKLTK